MSTYKEYTGANEATSGRGDKALWYNEARGIFASSDRADLPSPGEWREVSDREALEMSCWTPSGREPEPGNWPEFKLRDLVRLMCESRAPVAGYSKVSRLAMDLAKRTGHSYNWFLRAIEDDPNYVSPRAG